MNGATTTATSTLYAYDGDRLLATVRQTLENGTAIGTSTTQYVHTDNLNSTQATSNENGMLAEYFDYAPYGSVLAATSTAGTVSSGRQYIGQFADSSGLSYLNARYYEGGRGQFLNQDPVFLSGTQQHIEDPQSLNSYSYASGNPVSKSDPSGLCPQCLLGAGAGILAQYGYDVYNNINQNGLTFSDLYAGLSSPKTYAIRALQGAVIGATGGLASAEFFGTSLVAQSAVVGGVSGATGALANYWLGEPVTLQSVFWDTSLGGLTFGLSEFAPAVPGRLPNFGTKAFYMGAHTKQDAARLGVDSISGYLGALFGTSNFSSSGSYQTSYHGSSVSNSSTRGSSVSGQQFSSLVQVGNAFSPKNSAQSQALQNVFNAFTGGK